MKCIYMNFMIKLFDLLRKQSNNFISCISSLVSINMIKKIKNSCDCDINQTLKTSIQKTKMFRLILYILYHVIILETYLSYKVLSGLSLSGVCVANDDITKHKAMVQINSHFAIVVLSIE